MRRIVIGIGMLAIAGVAIMQPASAEEVIVRGGGAGVAIGVDGGHRDRIVERRVVRERVFARGGCRTIIIKREGFTKKIRRCD